MIRSTIQIMCESCRKMLSLSGGALTNRFARVHDFGRMPELWFETQTDVSILDLLDYSASARISGGWLFRALVHTDPETGVPTVGDYCSTACLDLAKDKFSGESKPYRRTPPSGSSAGEIAANHHFREAHRVSYEEAWLKRNFPLDQPIPADVRTRIALTKDGLDALEDRDLAIKAQREAIEERCRNAFYALAPYGPGEEVPKRVREDLYCTAEGRAALIKHDEEMQVLRATRDALRGPNWRSVLTWFGGRR